MNALTCDALMADLRQHLDLCQELFVIVERENQTLRHGTGDSSPEFLKKKNLLPFLNQSLNRLRQHRVEWHKQHPRERARETGVAALLREVQDLIMKIIVLDRENEQALLRKGLVPARHLPPANRQRPHYVADLYRRQTDALGSGPGSPG